MSTKYDDLLQLVKPKWGKAFLEFVESGQLDHAFAKYADSDPDCQRAIEIAFKRDEHQIRAAITPGRAESIRS